MSEKRVAFLTGLPRTGSTLLANVLGMHPEITATPTSPLASLVETLRQSWSQDEMLLAQLEYDRDQVYQRLLRSARAFIEAWSSDTVTPWTVDKGRFWLHHVELVRELYPDFRMIVCLRDLRDIYASIEKQHRKTLMLSLPGPPDANLIDNRAQRLFAHNGIIGGPLLSLFNLGDLADDLSENLFFWYFEEFLLDPEALTDRLLAWLDVEPAHLDLSEIIQSTNEADSFYRLKYLHDVKPTIKAPQGFEEAGLSRRILKAIPQRFSWYYRTFYSGEDVSFDRDDPSMSLQVQTPQFKP